MKKKLERLQMLVMRARDVIIHAHSAKTMTQRDAILLSEILAWVDDLDDICKEEPDTATRDNSGKLEASHFFEGMSKARTDFTLRQVKGAEKHGRLNWRKALGTDAHEQWVQICRDCIARHFWAFMDGEMVDEDGLTHLSGIMWNAAVLTEYTKT